MRIGIIGTRGIPNKYGGFEQFAQEFGIRMAAKGHAVYVYTSHNHPAHFKEYHGVQLIHCFDPEYKIGTAGQFIYDFNCIRDARKRNFDLILQLGYTSSTIWSWLYPKKPLLVTNMDGLEWARSKYSKTVQRFLKHAESWGVKHSDHLIADSKGIQSYLRQKYEADAVFVAYGAAIYDGQKSDQMTLDKYALQAGEYDLAIARFEPENSLELILKAYAELPERTLALVGNYEHTAFGKTMFAQYKNHPNIQFLGGIYETGKINELRYFSRIYYHGHTVGGTNPSLLEAMGCGALICAHDNEFNRHILQDAAFYFTTQNDIATLAGTTINKVAYANWIVQNTHAIATEFNWDTITTQLEDYFTEWLSGKK